MRNHGKQRLAASLAACALLFCTALTASANTYDMDGDGNLTAFDAALKKREALDNPDGNALADLAKIDAFLMGRDALGLSDGVTWLVEAPGTVHSGQATWYSGGITSGRCSLAPVPDGIYVCAINNTDYANGLLAGAYLRVTASNGNSVDVYVTDTSSQSSGSVDLNVNAFELLAAKSMGVLSISWQIIPFPGDQISYLFSSDSSSSWFSVQLRYHTYPIYSAEILRADGSYAALTRRSDNYFTGSGFGAGPFTFRLTDIYGNVIIEPNVPLSPGSTVTGTQNFPA